MKTLYSLDEAKIGDTIISSHLLQSLSDKISLRLHRGDRSLRSLKPLRLSVEPVGKKRIVAWDDSRDGQYMSEFDTAREKHWLETVYKVIAIEPAAVPQSLLDEDAAEEIRLSRLTQAAQEKAEADAWLDEAAKAELSARGYRYDPAGSRWNLGRNRSMPAWLHAIKPPIYYIYHDRGGQRGKWCVAADDYATHPSKTKAFAIDHLHETICFA